MYIYGNICYHRNIYSTDFTQQHFPGFSVNQRATPYQKPLKLKLDVLKAAFLFSKIRLINTGFVNRLVILLETKLMDEKISLDDSLKCFGKLGIKMGIIK